ncbi:MAG: TlpA family protein disulfide reductase [Vitreoscilla sp.]|nr:TlpA family protein disulfide reductase [Vitreoscilla sp.]
MSLADPDPAARAVANRRALVVLAVVAGLFAVAPPIVRRVRDSTPSAPDLRLHPAPLELPDVRFAGPQGTPTSLAAFRGRVVLLNFWATWCPPCREEMPALDRLQATLGGPDFEVVTLSIDEGGMPAVRAFMVSAKILHLRAYVDVSGDARSLFGVGGVPLTLLVDRDGRELGRKLGPAAWDHPDAVESIRGLLARDTIPSASVSQGGRHGKEGS